MLCVFRRPNEALLSINCFQKDLSDTNPLVRAWALRAMAGIRLHVVAPLVLAAVTKCARDPSPYVRKCAAYALPKLYDLQQEDNTSLEEVTSLLKPSALITKDMSRSPQLQDIFHFDLLPFNVFTLVAQLAISH